MSPREWTFTEDSADPCGLCVQWEEQPEDYLGEDARPVWPDGSTVERVYRYVHATCQDVAMRYSAEARL